MTMDSSSSSGSPSKGTVDGFTARDAWFADREMLNQVLSTYDNSTILGKGSSAQVFQVTHRETGETFACKIVRKSHMNDERTMSTETEIMMRLKHENLVQLHELFETSTSRWFIMELANAGTLQSALAAEVNYTEDLVAGLFKQILSGVKHLHDMGIVHRDLKQDNILVNVVETSNGEKKYVPKIADFGLSAVVGLNTNKDTMKMEKEMKNFRKLKDMWGTKEYFAPEVYKRAYGPQVDVWSLGCVLYELLTGLPAFPIREEPQSVLTKYLLNGGQKTRRMYQMSAQWRELSPLAQDLINKMLKFNPSRRYSLQECLNHPFIRNVRPESTVRTVGTPQSSHRLVVSKQFTADGRVIHTVNQVPQQVKGNSPRGKVLANARNAALLTAEKKNRRLRDLMEQNKSDANQRQ